MFIPADNMQIDENALEKIAEYMKVSVGTIIAWFQLNCMKDESTVDGFSKKLDIVRYKIDEDVRDIPVD